MNAPLTEQQTLLEPVKPSLCRICGKDYSIYGDNGLCDDCQIGLSIGQWVFDEWAESLGFTEEDTHGK
jgi:hypothetical protein